MWVQAEKSFEQFRPSGAHQTENAEHFATMQFKGNVAHEKVIALFRVGETQVFHAQNFCAAHRRLARIQFRQIAPDHHADDFLLGDGSCEFRANELSVAQHGEVVGDGRQFIEFVRDVNDCHAVALELVDQIEQHGDLRFGDSGGRLVHDDDSRLAGKRLGDFHDLLLADAQARDRRARIHQELQALQPAGGLAVHPGVVNPAGARKWFAT